MRREEELDWLCRLRSKIYVYMPKEWLIPMNNALDMAIKALEQEPRWIPVSERLPKKYDTVIGVNRFGDIYKTELYDDCGEKKWYADGDFDVPIVAWIPFPNYMKIESEE